MKISNINISEPYIYQAPYIITHKVIGKPLKRGMYVDVRTDPKNRRNQTCPCGSGLKYKNCCGLKRKK